MPLNCSICRKSLKLRQHKLECISCKIIVHRICMTLGLSYYNVKNSWKCNSCLKPAILNQKQTCICKKVIHKDNLCFRCTFPPISVHDLFHVEQVDFTEFIHFLFYDNAFSNFNKGIRAGYLNVNSLTNKHWEISDFLLNNKFDFFACSESKLTNNYTNELITPNEYDILRYDRHAKGSGGTVLYIRNDLKYHEIIHDVAFPDFVEVHAVKVYHKFRKPLHICL
jgi:hypothetical protein